ncbi:MAG: sel1 repeat family protein [Synergistaceae bacterium]|nr:sel1 repeat family protein [Synergistaceae bacterium]MBR0034708.1 sel1 repeat family protein [Synergistaceae bacterium]
MTHTIKITADDTLKSRIDFVCSELGLDVSALVSEALNDYFHKLSAEGRFFVARKDTPQEIAAPKNTKTTSQNAGVFSVAQKKILAKANDGDAEAQWKVSQYYWIGYRVPKDEYSAYMWFCLAMLSDFSPASEGVRAAMQSFRNTITNKLTPSLRKEAEQEAMRRFQAIHQG